MKNTIISPSILSADFGKMAQEVQSLQECGADWIHCDVMDGMFVPNLTFGFKMISDIKKITKLPLDVHLMIVEPERYVDRFIHAGADLLTFHLEATMHKAQEILQHISMRGVKAGLSISPDTPIEQIEPYLKYCDLVLLMSVYPGFGGQKFIAESLPRARQLKKLMDIYCKQAVLQIDGGVDLSNAHEIKQCGVQALVAGNTIFSAQNRAEVIRALKQA